MTDEQAPQTISNAFPNAQRWIDDYERHERDVQDIMMKAAKAVADGPGKFMKETLGLAKNDGIPIKVMRAALLERKHLRNAAKVRDKLDDELVDDLADLRASLAPVVDLPIFGAAVAAAEAQASSRSARKKREADAVDDVVNG